MTTATSTTASAATATELAAEEDDDEALRCIIDGQLEAAAAKGPALENETEVAAQPSATPPLQVPRLTCRLTS